MEKINIKKYEIPTYAVTEQDILTMKKVDKVPVCEKSRQAWKK